MNDCVLCKFSLPRFFTTKTGEITGGLHNVDNSVTVENIRFDFCPKCGRQLNENNIEQGVNNNENDKTVV